MNLVMLIKVIHYAKGMLTLDGEGLGFLGSVFGGGAKLGAL